MAVYQAKADSSLSFNVTKDEKLIGKLSYKSWFKYNAVIEAGNSSYQLKPKGFWGTTIELKDGKELLLKFSMNWKGEIAVQTYFNGVENSFILKHRGVFKESFILTDGEKTELLVMKPHLKWGRMNYEYQITTSDTFEASPAKEIILMASLYCANYYMSTIMAPIGL